MFEFVLVPLVVVVVAIVAWLMLSGRSERDPSSSVDAFHRALTAMQPEDEAEEAKRLSQFLRGRLWSGASWWERTVRFFSPAGLVDRA